MFYAFFSRTLDWNRIYFRNLWCSTVPSSALRHLLTPSVMGPRMLGGSFFIVHKPASGSNLPFFICSHIERISKTNFRNFHACVCVCVCVFVYGDKLCYYHCCITWRPNTVLKYFSTLYVVFVRVLFIVLCYCWYEVPFLSLATWLMSHHVNKRELLLLLLLLLLLSS